MARRLTDATADRVGRTPQVACGRVQDEPRHENAGAAATTARTLQARRTGSLYA